jgi:adenosylcobinamide-phosphate synthase
MQRPGLALGLLLGTTLDAVFADPAKGNPVAGFGTAASGIESRLWADSRLRGAFFVLLCAGSATPAGLAIEQRVRGGDAAPMAVTAVATWAVLGQASLTIVGVAVLAALIVRGIHGGEDR